MNVNLMLDNVKSRVIIFKYNGGSRPGDTRIVYVKEQNLNIPNPTIYGWDFTTEDYRRFRIDRVDNSVPPEMDRQIAVLNLNLLPGDLKDGVELKTKYEAEKNRVYIDEDSGIMAIVPEDVVQIYNKTYVLDDIEISCEDNDIKKSLWDISSTPVSLKFVNKKNNKAYNIMLYKDTVKRLFEALK